MDGAIKGILWPSAVFLLMLEMPTDVVALYMWHRNGREQRFPGALIED